MKEIIANAAGLVQKLKQQSKQLNDCFKVGHEDYGVKNYINKLNKLSLNSLDLFHEIEKQLNFLNNEVRSFEIRKRSELLRLQKQQERQNREQRRKE